VSWPDNVITPIPGWMHSRYFKLKSTTFTLPQIWRRELFVSVECKDEMQCLMLESNVMDFGFLERITLLVNGELPQLSERDEHTTPMTQRTSLKRRPAGLPGSFMNELRMKLCVIFSSFLLCTSHRKDRASAPAVVRLLRAHLVWFWWVIS
jgi:hypothetical protein